MPYSFKDKDAGRLEGTDRDRRSKLTPEQRETIQKLYLTGLYSQRELAREFKVDKRLISFIVDRHSLEKNKQSLKERGGSSIYYHKEKHTKSVREHRRYKKTVYDSDVKEKQL